MDNNATQHVSSQVETVNVHDSGIAYVGCTINVTNSTIRQTHGHLTDSSSLPSIIEDASLREYYIDTLCLAAPLPWYPDYTWNIEEIYTDLAIEGSEQRFPLEDLFTQAQKRYKAGGFFRILIEGDAGYGKSTLTLKLASDWANRNSHDKYNYLKHFDLLLTTRLGLVEENEDLLSHLKNIYEEKINVSLDDVLKGRGERQVLIVLDGYDEAKDTQKKMVAKIMEKSLWSKCHLIVTSRFGHVPKQIRGTNFCVTVKGYGTKQVAVAVGKFFIKSGHVTKEDAIRHSFNEATHEDFSSIDDAILLVPKNKRITVEQFQTFLDTILHQSPYSELTQCPLLCAMMCCLIGEFRDRRLPDTLSGLYFAMINRNLCRVIAKRSIEEGEDPEEWNWNLLKDKFQKDHHEYLNEFGLLCLQCLRKNKMLFTLFHLTGNDEVAKPNDPKIQRLVEAGVVIKSFGETCNTVYQTPHRTIAEFLAAYYLSNEKNEASVELSLLDLFAKDVSYKNVFQFCFEMKHEQHVINAFRDIKFPKGFLDKWNFLQKYLTDPEALTGYWSSLQQSLPYVMDIRMVEPYLHLLPKFHQNFQEISVTLQYDTLCGPNMQPMDDLLQLIKSNVNVAVGYNNLSNKNRSTPRPALFLDYGRTYEGGFLENVPPFIDKVLSSDIRVGSLLYKDSAYGLLVGAVLGKRPTSMPVTPVYDLQEAMRACFKRLLDSKNCPTHFTYELSDENALLSIIDALKVPSNSICCLKSLVFIFSKRTDTVNPTEEDLCRVLAEYWIPKRLEHLTLEFGHMKRCSVIIKPVIHEISLSASLSSLDLTLNTDMADQELDVFVMSILGSKLEILCLCQMSLTFNASSFSTYTEITSCCLKSLSLNNVTLKVRDPDLFAAKAIPLVLDKLAVDQVTVTSELLDWFCACLSSLRVFALGHVVKETSLGTKERHTTHFLDIITQRNAHTLEVLRFEPLFWILSREVMLQPIRNAVERCPYIHTVLMAIVELDQVQTVDHEYDCDGKEPDDDDNEPDVLSSQDSSVFLSEEQLLFVENTNICVALFKAILDAPKLQTTDFCLSEYPIRQAFCEAIADRAGKWPGRSLDRSDGPAMVLTLRDFDTESAAHAVTVFRQRKLDFRIQYVRDNIYEIWFPISSGSPPINAEER